MPFRDLALFAAFAIYAPMILVHPYLGGLAWVFFGLMNPHRLTFGPAFEFPFSLVIAILTFAGLFVSRDHRKLKGGAAGVVLVALMFWVTLTTLTALTPDAAITMWIRVMKIFIMTFVLMLVLHTRRQIELLAAIIALSIGFYGFKGGIFTIVTGGHGIVWGPAGSVIEGNTELGVAVVMIIPLLAHFYQQFRNVWIRLILLGTILTCTASVLGSYSRGALLALMAMGTVLWWRSSHKVVTLVLVLTTALMLVPFMPSQWDSRMQTIETYEQESSAMARIYAWHAAWNIATDRVFGGGFEYPSEEVMKKYSPGPYVSVAHSIYFQALGEHGFIGLALFLLFWLVVWNTCASTRKRARDRPELRWVYSLMSMIQASLVGYAIGGAFLNLAFWDMPYYLYATIIVTRYVVEGELAAKHAAPERVESAILTVDRLSSGRPVTSN
jgi:probable O-glycosylation ligase (exosortase A-associated)